jgi:hypothetical protein
MAAGRNLASNNSDRVPGAAAGHEGRHSRFMLGDEPDSSSFGDMMEERVTLLLQEYQEVNAHLRANTNQFVNLFSFS